MKAVAEVAQLINILDVLPGGEEDHQGGQQRRDGIAQDARLEAVQHPDREALVERVEPAQPGGNLAGNELRLKEAPAQIGEQDEDDEERQEQVQQPAQLLQRALVGAHQPPGALDGIIQPGGQPSAPDAEPILAGEVIQETRDGLSETR